jgi:hypothetical protein
MMKSNFTLCKENYACLISLGARPALLMGVAPDAIVEFLFRYRFNCISFSYYEIELAIPLIIIG